MIEDSSADAELETAVSQALALAVSRDEFSFEAWAASGQPPPRLLTVIEGLIGQATRDGSDAEASIPVVLHALRETLRKTLAEVRC
jgi:hypothetical protein